MHEYEKIMNLYSELITDDNDKIEMMSVIRPLFQKIIDMDMEQKQREEKFIRWSQPMNPTLKKTIKMKKRDK